MRSDGANQWLEVAPPTITAPAPNSAVSAALGFSITLGPLLKGQLTQTSADYEIRTAPSGAGSLVWSSANDLVNLLGIVVPIGTISGLVAGQTYYLRARVSAGGFTSSWSSDIRVTT